MWGGGKVVYNKFGMIIQHPPEFVMRPEYKVWVISSVLSVLLLMVSLLGLIIFGVLLVIKKRDTKQRVQIMKKLKWLSITFFISFIFYLVASYFKSISPVFY